MSKRIAFFAYGCFAYLIFLGTFLYAIAFVGGLGAPTSLDGERRGSLALSLAIDAGLLRDLRRAAQRHGAALVQGMVDAAGAAGRSSVRPTCCAPAWR